MVVLNYLFTTEEYTQENIRFTFLGGQAVLGKRKKFMCFIYIISSLKHIVQNYLEYKRFFDWIRQESCFYVHESNGNIVIAALFTSCSFYDKPLPRTRVLGLKLVRDCIQFFNSHHIHKSGEFDENLIPDELNLGEWRQYAIDYGIKTVHELSYQINKISIFRRLCKLHKVVKNIKGYIKMLDREVCQHTYIVGAAARTPSVGDEIYAKINLMSISDVYGKKFP